MERVYLVPTDFTNVARTALQHALTTVNRTGGRVKLLHVYGKKSDFNEAEENLMNEIRMVKDEAQRDIIDPLLRHGGLFDTIGEIALEEHVDLVFMGTHGAKGWQKIVGSDALKVITRSETPFIVCQSKNLAPEGFKNIVVPISFNKESKQKVEAVAEIGKYFNSTVHMIYQDASDAGLKQTISNNLIFTAKFFKEAGLNYKSYPSTGNFNETTVRYAKENNCDLIAIMNMQKDSILGGVLSKQYEQELLTNDEQIPVLVVNPRQVGVIGRGAASTST